MDRSGRRLWPAGSISRQRKHSISLKQRSDSISKCASYFTNTLAEQPKQPRRIVQLVIASAVVALAVWTLFYQLGQGSLEDWDEATYGQVAREMVQRGDWLTPS